MLRNLRGYTQQQLAARAGLNKTAISDYETGKREIPDPRRQQLLAALGLPLRAWDDTARHVEWLEWLAQGDGAAGDSGTAAHGCLEHPEPSPTERRQLTPTPPPYREIRRIAEAAGRDLERHLSEVLDVVTRSAW